MRRLALVTLLAVAPLWPQAPAPPGDAFTPVRFLVGEWKGEGDGKPGQSSGAATYRFELDGKALVRRNFADVPAANGRLASRHEDLMTLFNEGGVLKAFYLDNEGHVIRYNVETVPGGVAFTSESAPGPRFRLTYLKVSETLVTLRFEIAPPNKPEVFSTYIEAKTHKVK